MKGAMLLMTWAMMAWMKGPSLVRGHGRLMDPPARNSMWRLGFPNPVNYNDNELYCGGRMTQWARNNGKCGVCGDPFHAKREHEAGGKYANGIITREYKQGDVIDVTVHVTANHKGFFEFRICPVDDPKVEVTQECLDKYVLEKADGNGTKYMLPESQSNQFFNVSLRLPADLTCNQCVIQWKYRTGNTWDKDESGKFCVGCGPQEEFYNCADVSVHGKGSTKSSTSRNSDLGKFFVDPKKSALVFSNDGTDYNSYNMATKDGDSVNPKDKFLQESSKYSVLTLDGKSTQEKQSEPISSINANEIIIQALKKLKDPSSILSSEKKLEGAATSPAYPTGPSFVPYKWRAGSPKASTAEELRRRFAYGLTGHSPLDKKEAGENLAPSPMFIPTIPQLTKSQKLSEANEDLSQETVSKDESLLKKWNLLKSKHLTTQKSVNDILSTSTSSVGQAKKKGQQALQDMREKGKKRMNGESRSPFVTLKTEKNKTAPLREETRHAQKKVSEVDAFNSQKTMKKRLPTWLITALKMKINSEKENKNLRTHDNNKKTDAGKEKTVSLHLNDLYKYETEKPSVTKNFDFEDGPFFLTPRSSVKKTNRDFAANTNAAIGKSQVEATIAKHTYPSPKPVSFTEALVESQKSQDNKGSKDDTETLIRYILTTLLSRKNKADGTGESETASDLSKDYELFRNKADTQRTVTSTKYSDVELPWYTPSRSLNKMTGLLAKTPTMHQTRVQPYNNVLLGSDYGYDQRQSGGSGKSRETMPKIWASHNAYDNSAVMNAYASSLNRLYGDHESRKRNFISGEEIRNGLSYEDPVGSRGIATPYQSNHVQSYPWLSSEAYGSDGEFLQDPNHIWALRAQKRQTHYHQQPAHQNEKAQLVCKALVAFGGGMDKWCTDNCNANFCPPSICVCKKQVKTQLPILSAFTAADNTVDGRSEWDTPLPKERQVTRNHATREATLYNSVFQNYAPSNEQTMNFDRSQRSNTNPFFNPFHTNPIFSPNPTVTTFGGFKGFGDKVPERMFGSAMSEEQQHYAKAEAFMNKNMAGGAPHGSFYDRSENSVGVSSNNHILKDSLMPVNRVDWLSGGKDFVGNDVTSKILSHQGGMLTPGQDASFPQYVEVPPRRPHTNCRAVGAYRGLDHFDEWCETTCYSSMCPLLMCKCDN